MTTELGVDTAVVASWLRAAGAGGEASRRASRDARWGSRWRGREARASGRQDRWCCTGGQLGAATTASRLDELASTVATTEAAWEAGAGGEWQTGSGRGREVRWPSRKPAGAARATAEATATEALRSRKGGDGEECDEGELHLVGCVWGCWVSCAAETVVSNDC